MKNCSIISRNTGIFVFNCILFAFFYLQLTQGVAEAVGFRSTVFKYENGNLLEKRMALQNLLEYEEEELFVLFKQATTHNDPYIRKYAYEGLSRYSFELVHAFLVRALRDKSKMVVRNSIPLFLPYQTAGVADLLFLLKHHDPEIVMATLKVLGYVGDTHTFFSIASLFKSRNPEVRVQALNSVLILLQRKGMSIKSDLDGDFEFSKRNAAIDALDHITRPLMAHLRKTLTANNLQEKKTAIQAVAVVGGIFFEKLEAYMWFEEDEQLLKIAKRIHTSLLGLLPVVTSYFYSGPEELNWHILSFLTVFRQKESFMVFLDALEGNSIHVRAAAINGLTKIVHKDSLPTLLPFLNDPNPIIKVRVMEALYEMGGENEASLIIPLLHDRNAHVQWHAAKTLGVLSSPNAVDPLISILQSKNMVLRKAAVNSLGQLSDEKALSALKLMVNDSEHQVREAVGKALGRLENRAQAEKELFDLLLDENKYVRRSSLLSIGLIIEGHSLSLTEGIIVGKMIGLLKDADFFMRGLSLRVLSRFHDNRILPAIYLLLKGEENSIVREEAEMAVSALLGKK